MRAPSRLTRRAFIAAAASAPALAACTHFSDRYRSFDGNALASTLGVCAATYAVLRRGTAEEPRAISGCLSPETVDPHSIFQAASLTKPVIAYGCLRLVRDTGLVLDAPVSRYLSNGYLHRQNLFETEAAPVTDLVSAATLGRISLRSLLRHSSGLPNWSSGPLVLNPTQGERWQYSGEGYVLLQRVIEAVTGMELDAYFLQQVFAPIGMRSSGLRWNSMFGGRAVIGTSAPDHPRQHRFVEPVAAASLYTTADDYSRFLSALLADESVMKLTVTEPITADADLGLDWGLGWGIERGPGGPYLWQWGNNPGFRAFAMVSESSKDGFVVLTNSERGMPLAVPIANTVLPGRHNAFKFHMVG